MKVQYQVIQKDNINNLEVILYDGYSRYFKDIEKAKETIEKLKKKYPEIHGRTTFTIRKREVTPWEDIEII